MKKHFIHSIFLWLLISFQSNLSAHDIATFYAYGNDDSDIREFVLTQSQDSFLIPHPSTQFKAHQNSLADTIYQSLSCVGDFNGDGQDEIALFTKNRYNPNCMIGYSCPPYFKNSIILLEKNANSFAPSTTWIEMLDSAFSFNDIRFSAAIDKNNDGKTDLIAIGNDSIFTFQSNGNEFTLEAQALNTESINNLLAGDFNGDGLGEFAYLKNDSIFTVLSNGNEFGTPLFWGQIPDSLEIHLALSGKFTADQKTDICILAKTNEAYNKILLFKSELDSFQLSNASFIENSYTDDFQKVLFAKTADFTGDGLDDIVWAYDTDLAIPSEHIIHVLASNDSLFLLPKNYLVTSHYEFNFHKLNHFLPGKFTKEEMLSVCTWKNNKQGALTFSFDDGYTSSIEEAKYLYTKGLRGTHNIISHLSGTEEYADWETIKADSLGNEYGSHSFTHHRLNQTNITGAIEQLVFSKNEMDSALSQNTSAFVFPGGGFSNNVLQLPELRTNYLSARTSMNGYNISSPRDMYALKSKVIVNTTSPEEVFTWIDKTIENNYWTFLMYHYINYQGSDPDLAEYNSTIADFHAVVDYAAASNCWIDTHSNIAKYVLQRDAIKTYTYAVIDPNTILIQVDDNLNDSVFDQKITLKIYVDNSWTNDSVLIYQNGDSCKAKIENESGKNYVLANLLPSIHEAYISNYSLPTKEQNAGIFSFSVSPNPVIEYAEVKWKNSTDEIRIQLHDINGYLVFDKNYSNVNSTIITRKDYAPGIYLLSTYSKGKLQYCKKIIFK